LQPAAVFFVGFISVYEDVAIAVFGSRFAHRDFLVPAVLSADRIGLDGKRQVLVYAGIFPVNAG
jgi:hypothetical protein